MKGGCLIRWKGEEGNQTYNNTIGEELEISLGKEVGGR